MRNRIRLASVLGLALAAVPAAAADIEILLQDSSAEGALAFSPGFVRAEVGDTLVFRSGAGHNSQSVLVPPGASGWQGPVGNELRVTLDTEGVYIYVCNAHERMGMVGVAQAGKAVNLAEARAKAAEESAKFVLNKARLDEELAQVH